MLKIFRWIPPVKEPYALYLMIRDPRTPTGTRLGAFSIIALIFAYTFSPIDLIPDYLPVIGWLDDLVLFPLGIMLIEKLLPQDILLDNRAIARQRVNGVLFKVIIGVAIALILGAAYLALLITLIIKLF